MEWLKDDRGLISADQLGYVIEWNLFPQVKKEDSSKPSEPRIREKEYNIKGVNINCLTMAGDSHVI